MIQIVKGPRGGVWTVDTEARSVCTRCGHEGPAYEDFGFSLWRCRKTGKKTQRTNPQCKPCRNQAARKATEKGK